MRSRKVVGEKLKVAREDLWLTKTELAEKAGVSVATISQIENEHNPYPRRDTVFAIAKALDEMNPNELLEGANGNGPLGTVRGVRALRITPRARRRAERRSERPGRRLSDVYGYSASGSA